MSLLNTQHPSSHSVKRHLTAIRRNNLSRPVQLLLETGVLSRDSEFLDYGCGFGDDVRILSSNGYTAVGWDPHFAPNEPKHEADIVNLGFVLNVIEDPKEREASLREAYELCREVLCVGVLYAVEANQPAGTRFGDGVVTQKQTFQRTYTQDEISEFVARHTSDMVATVGPGVVFAFKDAERYRRFRYGRVHRRAVAIEIPDFEGTVPGSQIEQLVADYPQAWEEYARFLGERGRPPQRVEAALLEKAASRRISPKPLYNWACAQLGVENIVKAAEQTKTDLLVFLAMSLFENRTRMSDLDASAQADVKHWFGAFNNALSNGREALLAVGDTELIQKQAEEAPVGVIQDGGLFVRPSHVPQLPLHVRIYVMLGTLFFGDLSLGHLIKVHLHSNKLTFYMREPEDNGDENKANATYDAYKVDFVNRKISYYVTSDRFIFIEPKSRAE